MSALGKDCTVNWEHPEVATRLAAADVSTKRWRCAQDINGSVGMTLDVAGKVIELTFHRAE